MKNMFSMLKQAQEMKTKFSELKKNIDNTSFFGESYDGKVKVKVTGKGALLDISIVQENNDNKSDLENAIKSAYFEAKKKADDFCESEMNKATGGISLPFDMKNFL